MRIIDESCLEAFRYSPVCECCGGKLRGPSEPHHIFSRGAGRLDIRINLIALGGPFECGCHRLYHDGKITREELLGIAALREGFTYDSVELAIFALRRSPKEADAGQVQAEWLKKIPS